MWYVKSSRGLATYPRPPTPPPPPAHTHTHTHTHTQKWSACCFVYSNEPQRQKTYLLICAPNKDSTQLPFTRILVTEFAVRIIKSENSLSAWIKSENELSTWIKSESSLSVWRSIHPWLSKQCPVKILIRLRECTGWSESSLGAHVRRYVFCRRDSYILAIFNENLSAWFVYSKDKRCYWTVDSL